MTRQLDDARALAAARGWKVILEVSDNDVSALRGVPRTGYRAVMDAATAGRIDKIVCWHTSRLWRNRSERAGAIEALAKARVGVLAVKGPDLDLSTAYGRGMAGLLGEFDTLESEIKGERVARAAAERAQNGRGNGAVLYGWKREPIIDDGRPAGFRDVEDPETADVVREVVDRLLAGHTLAAIRADLNERGVPAPGAGWKYRSKRRAIDNAGGERWGRTSVKKLAMRPANAGLRVHHRGRPDEALYSAAWPALVPRERWEQVCALLDDPSRKIVRPASRQHLLTWGIGSCGICGGHLRVARKGAVGGKRHVLYVCDEKGCVGRNEKAVDDLVSAVVIERLSRPDAASLFAPDSAATDAARDQARSLRTRLDDAADSYAEAKITAPQLERITARLRPDLDAAEREVASASAVPVDLMAGMTGGRAEAAWEALSVQQRRMLLDALGLAVKIIRVTRRGPGFDPQSVIIEWRQS